MTIPPQRPRILLTTTRALAIVTACYVGTACAAIMLFAAVENARGEQAASIFTAIMGACWLWSAVAIVRARFCR